MITDIERYDSNIIDVHFESSGVDVILYIGENPHSKINRIKVSNINLLSNKLIYLLYSYQALIY